MKLPYSDGSGILIGATSSNSSLVEQCLEFLISGLSSRSSILTIGHLISSDEACRLVVFAAAEIVSDPKAASLATTVREWHYSNHPAIHHYPSWEAAKEACFPDLGLMMLDGDVWAVLDAQNRKVRVRSLSDITRLFAMLMGKRCPVSCMSAS